MRLAPIITDALPVMKVQERIGLEFKIAQPSRAITTQILGADFDIDPQGLAAMTNFGLKLNMPLLTNYSSQATLLISE